MKIHAKVHLAFFNQPKLDKAQLSMRVVVPFSDGEIEPGLHCSQMSDATLVSFPIFQQP